MSVFSSLGIDWFGVLVYLVNFGVLFLVVLYFVTGPLLSMLDRRRKTIADTLNESEKLRVQMAEILEQSKRERSRMGLELADERAHMKKEMEAKQKEAMARLEEKKAHLLGDAREMILQEKDRLVSSAEKELLSIMQRVILRVMKGAPMDLVRKSVEDGWRQSQSIRRSSTRI